MLTPYISISFISIKLQYYSKTKENYIRANQNKFVFSLLIIYKTSISSASDEESFQMQTLE